MTIATETQHHFTAAIQSKGKARSGNGWALTLGWRFPGSQYDLILNGQDWETIEAHDVGDTVIITIQQGNLKKDKTGQYSSDYFWDMVSIEPTRGAAGDEEKVASDEAPPVQAPPRPPDAPPTPEPSRRPPDMDPPPNPAARGACHNHAVDFIVRGLLPVPDGRELFGWIRELRDRFYREINQSPLSPLHYCYEHDQERRQSKTGNWGHILPKEADDQADSYCIAGREGWRVFDDR